MKKGKRTEYRNIVSVACINFGTIWGNKEATLEKMEGIVREAATRGNDIVVFPEMSLSGYECSEDGIQAKGPCTMHEAAAETVPGPSTEEMAKLCQELQVYVIFGMAERDREDPSVRYNASAVIGPEGILGTYRKLHLSPLPDFSERYCFKAGNKVPVWETRFGPIGVLICYDFWTFPELARIMALKGARLLVNTSASVAAPGKPYFMVQQTGARATENAVFAASANIAGRDRAKVFYGHSTIAGPTASRKAHIYVEGGEGEEIVSATLNFDVLAPGAEQPVWKEHHRSDIIAAEFRRLARHRVERKSDHAESC